MNSVAINQPITTNFYYYGKRTQCTNTNEQSDNEHNECSEMSTANEANMNDSEMSYANECEHDAEPIKDIETIHAITNYFLSQNNLRNYTLFVVGINVGLRISDLLNLRFSNIINPDGSYKHEIVITEQKTKNTRKHIKRRVFALSDIAINAIESYRQSLDQYTPDLYIFRNETTAYKYSKKNKPMTRQGVQYFINKAFDELHITTRHGTHVLRKTFAYHVLTGTTDAVERSRRLEILQDMFNHSSPRITLAYAGISKEEKINIYQSLTYGLEELDLKERM